MADYNERIIEEFRANEGRVGGPFEGAPLLLLTHMGRRTGTVRTTPLMYLREDGRLFVFASKGGHPHHPHWFLNLQDRPDVEVELGTDRFPARAVEIRGRERDEIYARQSEMRPQFGEYQRQTSRTIPVVELVPAEAPQGPSR
jgi:deazaflavin-dependent oxidoreductase (nitroreductase family)